jgi:hypothetical protein
MTKIHHLAKRVSAFKARMLVPVRRGPVGVTRMGISVDHAAAYIGRDHTVHIRDGIELGHKFRIPGLNVHVHKIAAVIFFIPLGIVHIVILPKL